MSEIEPTKISRDSEELPVLTETIDSAHNDTKDESNNSNKNIELLFNEIQKSQKEIISTAKKILNLEELAELTM